MASNTSTPNGFHNVLTVAEIFDLPRDIVLSIFFQWLPCKDLTQLIDSNVTNKSYRSMYLSMIESYPIPSANTFMNFDYLEWINRRKLKLKVLHLETRNSSCQSISFKTIVSACQNSLIELSLSHVPILTNKHLLYLTQSCAATLKWLEIDNCKQITSECLTHMLKRTKVLSSLHLIGFNFTYLSIFSAYSSVSTSSLPVTSIQSLKIISQIPDNAVSALLRMCPELTNLHFELINEERHLNQMNYSWINNLSEHCPKLVSMTFHSFLVLDSSMLEKICHQLVNLEVLHIEEGVFSLESMLLSSLFSHVPNDRDDNYYAALSLLHSLRELSWQGPCVTTEHMMQIVKAVKCLKKVDFTYNAGVNDEFIQVLTEHHAQLEEIILPSLADASQAITDKSILAITKHCHALKSLIIADASLLTSLSLQYIAQHCQNLHNLELYRTPSSVSEEKLVKLSMLMKGKLRKMTIGRSELSIATRRNIIAANIHLTYDKHNS